MSNEEQILNLLMDPETGIGALVTGQKALHNRLDVFMKHCDDTHVALNATSASRELVKTAAEAAIAMRVTALENAKLLANGVRKGRLDVLLVLAKILALVGVGSGGVGVLVALLRAAFGG